MRVAMLVGISFVSLAACGGGGPSGPTAPLPSAAPTVPPPSPGPAPAESPSPPPPAMSVVRVASLGGANGHSASGTARIVQDGGRHVLELGDDFRIDSGNNDVYLARSRNGVDNGDLNLGNMKATTGRQTYELPNDGSRYGFVILWCRPFRVPIGVGQLR